MSGERIRPIKPSEIKPIKPKEIAEKKLKSLPDQVLESFNELIAENYKEFEAKVHQNEVVQRMIDKGLMENDIYKKGWLGIEEIYRQAGWRVTYDRPVYYAGEDFEPYFTFIRTRRRIS